MAVSVPAYDIAVPVAPAAPAGTDALSFEEAIAELRDDVFALVDVACHTSSADLPSLNVCLQSVANELGRAERLLRTRR